MLFVLCSLPMYLVDYFLYRNSIGYGVFKFNCFQLLNFKKALIMSSEQCIRFSKVNPSLNTRDSLELIGHLLRPNLFQADNKPLQHDCNPTASDLDDCDITTYKTYDDNDDDSSIEVERNADSNYCNVSKNAEKMHDFAHVLKLEAVSPKIHTPLRLPVIDPTIPCKKSKMRTSSPDDNKIFPRAKKLLMESLELSPISSPSLCNSSIELQPRSTTPGTVNSDEIVGQDFTSLSSSLQEPSIFVDAALRTSFCLPTADSFNCQTQEAAPPLLSDVIESLPSPKPTRPVYVVIEKQRCVARDDVLGRL